MLLLFGPIILLVGFLGIFAVGLYNKLVARRNRCKNAFAQIDVQLKRRYDLSPRLVETAKGYLKHERETLEVVIKARTMAVAAEQQAARDPSDAKAMQQLIEAEAGLAGVLGRLFALSEAYPDLKADQTMNQLTEELTSTENRIAFARQAYNDAVVYYNTTLEKFPTVLLADALSFKAARYFEAASGEERAAPKLSFA